MTETENINPQYQTILLQLQFINPNLNLNEINQDVEDLLFELFIDEIHNLELSSEISFSKLRKKMIRQKLQSFRQSEDLKELKIDKIKKDEKHFKLKRIQNSLKRKALYYSIDYSGTFSKDKIFYINQTDQTHLSRNILQNIYKDDNQEIYQGLNEDDKSSRYERENYNDFNELDLETIVDYLENPEIMDLFKEFKEVEEKKAEKDTIEIESELDLRKRIRNLDLKPITKKESKELNLLDYIGFVDED